MADKATQISREDLKGFAENPMLWGVVCVREEVRLAVLKAIEDLESVAISFPVRSPKF